MTEIASKTDPRVLVLAPGDNVAIAKSDIPASTTLKVMGATVTLKISEETGHKFAFKPIKKGETIGRIAHKYHVTIPQLRAWNGLKKDRILEGQTLRIRSQ